MTASPNALKAKKLSYKIELLKYDAGFLHELGTDRALLRAQAIEAEINTKTIELEGLLVSLGKWQPVAMGNTAIKPLDDEFIDSNWSVQIKEGSVRFQRLSKGKIVESYLPLSRAEAAVHLMAIIQGFQPPRGLLRQDKPFDEIPY